MPNLTTNYSFNKPLVNDATDEDLWGGYLNDNWDSVDSLLSLTGGFSVNIEAVTDQDYTLYLKTPFAGTITETTSKSASGTCTATFKVNTTALGGTANSVSTSEQSQSHSSSNTFVAGDDIVVTISSNSSCTNASLTVKYTALLS